MKDFLYFVWADKINCGTAAGALSSNSRYIKLIEEGTCIRVSVNQQIL